MHDFSTNLWLSVTIPLYTYIHIYIKSHSNESRGQGEVPREGLLMNAHEYFTRTNLNKIKYAISDKPLTRALSTDN